MPFRYSPITDFQQLNAFIQNLAEYINAFGKIVTDQYVGTGAQLEVFLGFQPKLIIIMQEANPADIVLWYGSLTSPNSYNMATGAQLTTAILGSTLKRDGFLLGTSGLVNTIAITYKYVVSGT